MVIEANYKPKESSNIFSEINLKYSHHNEHFFWLQILFKQTFIGFIFSEKHFNLRKFCCKSVIKLSYRKKEVKIRISSSNNYDTML